MKALTTYTADTFDENSEGPRYEAHCPIEGAPHFSAIVGFSHESEDDARDMLYRMLVLLGIENPEIARHEDWEDPSESSETSQDGSGDDETVFGEPEAGDYVIVDTGALRSGSSLSIIDERFLGVFNSDEAAHHAARLHMTTTGVYPNVWKIGSDGQPTLLTEEDL